MARGLLAYVVRRLLILPLTFLAITILVFAIYQMLPGEPIDRILPPQQAMRPDIRERAMVMYGLDKPAYEQYWMWLTNFFRGDWGFSFKFNFPVIDLVSTALPYTIALNLIPFVVSLPASIWLGIKMATKANSKLDRSVAGITLLGYSFPSIVLGLFLVYLFCEIMPIFPASGMESREIGDILRHMALPVIAILIGSFAYLQRYTRSIMLEVLREDYIRTARSKGLNEKTVIYKHAFRNTMIPMITLLVSYLLVGLISSSFILEKIFSWPGLGRLTVDAALIGDIYVIMAVLVIYSMIGFVAYIIRDIAYAYLDPRVRLS